MFIENKKNIFPKFLEYGIYSLFTIFPFFIFNSFLYQGTSSRFLILCLFASVLAICISFYFFKKENKFSFLRSPILLIFGIYFVYLFISAIFGVDFSMSFWSRAERTSGLFYLTHLAIFTLFLISAVSLEKVRNNLIKIVLITSAVYSFCSLLGPQGFGFIFKSNPYDGFLFGNSSFAAMYLLGAFLLSLYFLARKGVKDIKWYEYFFPILIFLNPFFVNIKGGYDSISSFIGIAQASSIALFTSLGILVIIFLISKIRNIKIRNTVGIVTFVFALLFLAWGMRSLLISGGVVRNIYEQQSTPARLLVWEISKNAISDKPLTGWGGDNYTVAYQENFDIRLLTTEYGNEPWFDRAHNIVLDQAVDGGYIGTVLYFSLYVVLFLCLLFVLLKTKKRENGVLASVLITYFFVHLLELQTAFDTTISAVMFVLMVALTVYVFDSTRQEFGSNTKIYLGNVSRVVFGSVLLGYFSWSLFFGVIPFLSVQATNGEIRTVGSAEKRIPLYEKLFDTKFDRAGILWKTSIDFEKGIAETPDIIENPQKVTYLIQELEMITKAYEQYVLENPDNFRARLNLADVYIYQMLFGVNRLKDAEAVLDEAIAISDKHPQPYWMKAVIYLYQRDFAQAREYVVKAKEMNKDAVETQRLEQYIESSIKTFPEIDLYFFNQI